jgi:hypothetical protein
MNNFYESLRAGDIVYFRKGRILALVRILQIKYNRQQPDVNTYNCRILHQKYKGGEAVKRSGKLFTASRKRGFVYSHFWEFYSIEEFEAQYPNLAPKAKQVLIKNRQKARLSLAIGLCAAIVVLATISLILLQNILH